MRISLDIGGVMSRYPVIFREIARALARDGHEIFVITDIPDHATAVCLVEENGFGDLIPADHVESADYRSFGEMCKADVVRRLQIDVAFDDYPAYLAGSNCLGLFVWPRPELPYEAPGWRNCREGER